MSSSSHVLLLQDYKQTDNVVYAVETKGGHRRDTTKIERVGKGHSVDWFWPGKIPRGLVTVIEGAAGAGKSWVAFDLVARMGGQAPCPDGVPIEQTGMDVLVVSRHPEAARVGRHFNHADASQLHRFHSFNTEGPDPDSKLDPEGLGVGGRRPVAFPFDLPALDFQLHLRGTIGVVVIDSLSDFCATPRQAAETLAELERIAEDYDVAMIVTVPGNCRVDVEGRLRVSSRWNTDAARCVWCLLENPDDPSRRLFVPRRTNYGLEPSGMAFRIGSEGVVWEAGTKINRLDPLGELAAVDEFLEEMLGDGPIPSKTVLREGAEMGFHPKQLRRGAKRLGMTYQRVGFSGDGGWVWKYADPEIAGPPVEGEPLGEAITKVGDKGILDRKVPVPAEPAGHVEEELISFEEAWDAPITAGEDALVQRVAAPVAALTTAEAKAAIQAPVAEVRGAAGEKRGDKKPLFVATESRIEAFQRLPAEGRRVGKRKLNRERARAERLAKEMAALLSAPAGSRDRNRISKTRGAVRERRREKVDRRTGRTGIQKRGNL